jgi:hypothetical protein
MTFLMPLSAMPLAWRPFVDPVDAFAGMGWLWMLPPLVFASALVYHALRSDGDFPLVPVLRRAGWTALKALAVLFALMVLVWWI